MSNVPMVAGDIGPPVLNHVLAAAGEAEVQRIIRRHTRPLREIPFEEWLALPHPRRITGWTRP